MKHGKGSGVVTVAANVGIIDDFDGLFLHLHNLPRMIRMLLSQNLSKKDSDFESKSESSNR